MADEGRLELLLELLLVDAQASSGSRSLFTFTSCKDRVEAGTETSLALGDSADITRAGFEGRSLTNAEAGTAFMMHARVGNIAEVFPHDAADGYSLCCPMSR